MWSFLTIVVTSLDCQPIRCPTMLCRFGRTWNGYVATHIILLGSAAESSATSGYVVAPEHFGQNEGRASRNEEQAEKKPSFLPSSRLNRCSFQPLVDMNFIHHWYVLCFMYSYFFLVHFYYFPLVGKPVWFLFMLLFIMSARENHFDVHLWRIWFVLFPSKDRKDSVYEERNGRRGVYFPPESAFLLNR